MQWRKAVTAIACASALGAYAHGDEHAAPKAKAKYDYSKAEETAFGRAADPAKATRTVAIEMADTMKFSPSQVTVKRGESIRFVATNKGKVPHEMVLGTRKELEEHAALMRKFPEMEHDDPNMLHVAPGKSGDMGWQFTKAGEFYYGCLEPGHYEAGMVGKVVVVDASAAPASDYSEGEVHKIDKDAGKITLKHGAIANLEMPPMSMVFSAKDPALLDKVKVGDKVRFKAEKIQGALTVTEIEAAK